MHWAVLSQNLPDYQTISTAQSLSQGMVFAILQNKKVLESSLNTVEAKTWVSWFAH